jgi:hypothetical protein
MFYVIPDTLLKVALNTNRHFQQCVSYYIEHGDKFYWRLLPLFNNVSGIRYNMVTRPIKLITMLYAIPDTLLKVSLNTNKTGDHVIRNT